MDRHLQLGCRPVGRLCSRFHQRRAALQLKPGRPDKKVETLTVGFANMSNDHGDLQIAWDNTMLSMKVETDVDARIMANIDKAMQGEKKPYYFAAIYYYNHNKDMHKALAWMEERDKAQPNAYNVKYWKARIQLKMGTGPAPSRLRMKALNWPRRNPVRVHPHEQGSIGGCGGWPLERDVIVLFEGVDYDHALQPGDVGDLTQPMDEEAAIRGHIGYDHFLS